MRISDWSSDVCSSDLIAKDPPCRAAMGRWQREALTEGQGRYRRGPSPPCFASGPPPPRFAPGGGEKNNPPPREFLPVRQRPHDPFGTPPPHLGRSEEDTTERPPPIHHPYVAFCLKKKKQLHKTIKY